MKTFRQSLCAFLLSCLSVLSGQAAVLLDDDWDDADRTDTNLPEEAAWYSSVVSGNPTLSATAYALTANVRVDANTSSRLWITHFTPAGSPAELAVGDTLKLTLDFVPRNVVLAPPTQRGMRLGLFNFSEPGAARVTGDGFSTGAGAGAPGTNVTGYILNMNFAQAFTTGSPLQIMKRTDMITNNLMGASGSFLALGSGGGTNGSPGFINDVPYRFEFSVRRLGAAVEITTKFSDTNGWNISHTVTDASNPTFKFDGFAIRPNGALDTADAFVFTRLKVETIPYELKITAVHFKTPTVLELRWDAIPGTKYEVQSRSGLEPDKTWDLLGTVDAQTAAGSFEDGDVAFLVQRFYRLLQQP